MSCTAQVCVRRLGLASRRLGLQGGLTEAVVVTPPAGRPNLVASPEDTFPVLLENCAAAWQVVKPPKLSVAVVFDTDGAGPGPGLGEGLGPDDATLTDFNEIP